MLQLDILIGEMRDVVSVTPYLAFVWYFFRNYDNMNEEKLRKLWKYYIGTELNLNVHPDQDCYSLHKPAVAFTRKALGKHRSKGMIDVMTIASLDLIGNDVYKQKPTWTDEDLVAMDWADDPDMNLDYYEWGLMISFREDGSLEQTVNLEEFSDG